MFWCWGPVQHFFSKHFPRSSSFRLGSFHIFNILKLRPGPLCLRLATPLKYMAIFSNLPEAVMCAHYLSINDCVSCVIKFRSMCYMGFSGWSALLLNCHYSDVIMGVMASQITDVTIVYSTICPGADKKHQSSASLTFARGIHRWPVNSPHKGPVTRKMLPFDDVIMMHILPFFHLSVATVNLNRITNTAACSVQQ